MELDKVLADLGVELVGEMQDMFYTVTLENSDDYSRIYTIMDSAPNFEFIQEKSKVDILTSVLFYLNEEENISVMLTANFDDDLYKIAIGEEE